MGNINKQQQSCNELRLVEPRLLTPNGGGGGSSAPHSRRIENKTHKKKQSSGKWWNEWSRKFFLLFLSFCLLFVLFIRSRNDHLLRCAALFPQKRCGGNQTQRPRSGPAAPSLPSKVLCNYNWVMDDERGIHLLLPLIPRRIFAILLYLTASSKMLNNI